MNSINSSEQNVHGRIPDITSRNTKEPSTMILVNAKYLIVKQYHIFLLKNELWRKKRVSAGSWGRKYMSLTATQIEQSWGRALPGNYCRASANLSLKTIQFYSNTAGRRRLWRTRIVSSNPEKMQVEAGRIPARDNDIELTGMRWTDVIRCFQHILAHRCQLRGASESLPIHMDPDRKSKGRKKERKFYELRQMKDKQTNNKKTYCRFHYFIISAVQTIAVPRPNHSQNILWNNIFYVLHCSFQLRGTVFLFCFAFCPHPQLVYGNQELQSTFLSQCGRNVTFSTKQRFSPKSCYARPSLVHLTVYTTLNVSCH